MLSPLKKDSCMTMSATTTSLTESTPQSPLIDSASLIFSSKPGVRVTRAYKSANQLFLTRRIREALEILLPLVVPSTDLEATFPLVEEDANSHHNSLAPVSGVSKTARVRVWSLYISILNEVVEMGPDFGKETFGAARWKYLVALARTGSIWEDIVRNGYGGSEGNVDPDVVANLATLLLAHMTSQRLTQNRLETYLSAWNSPDLDIAAHLEQRNVGVQSKVNGTSTPRDLNSRLKILEIYALHVLPRNSEWDYAREFIGINELLDEEKREAFLQALQSVQEEQGSQYRREAQLQRQRDQQLEEMMKQQERARRAEQDQEKEQRRKTQAPSRTNEHDYGIDRSHLGDPHKQSRTNADINGVPTSTPKLPARRRTSGKQLHRHPDSGTGLRKPSLSVYMRLSALMEATQKGLVSIGNNLRSNPTSLLRMLAFLIAFVMALARRDVRDRLSRMRDESWSNLKRTVGMGVKVSYI